MVTILSHLPPFALTAFFLRGAAFFFVVTRFRGDADFWGAVFLGEDAGFLGGGVVFLFTIWPHFHDKKINGAIYCAVDFLNIDDPN